jgi:NAD(P)-dependent dehydrogenase (short-subunit alcohol dehydrogenase family)
MRILITGASRGIGLELARQCAARGDEVFACARTPDTAHKLKRINNVTIVPLDVVDEQSINAAASFVASKVNSLDVLINNAAINPETPPYESFGQLRAQSIMEVLHTNTVAPLIVAQAFLNLISKGNNPRLINVSSGMGSISDRTYGGSHSYCMSKAALNMASRGLASDVRSRKIVVIALDPGWVQTDMGGAGASLTPKQSVNGILKVVDNLTLKDTGKFYDYRGTEQEW